MTTVESLAAAKKLDAAWLRGLGVEDLPGGGVMVAYFDQDNAPLFARRRDVPGSRKRFDQPYRTPLRPYGLWRLADFDQLATLYLTEGESDAWALWAEGYPALGIPGNQSFGCLAAADLAGVECLFVCLDSDEGGAQFGQQMAKHLAAAGYQGKAYALSMPQGVKDVCDLRAADVGGFADAFGRARAAAATLLAGPAAQQQAAAASQEPEPVTVCLADVKAEPVLWLMPGWLPLGELAILDGDPGLGKSTLTLDLAARLSRGHALPPLDGPDLGRGPCSTLLLGAEDSLSHTIRPRLDAMGADCNLVHSLEAMSKDGEERPVVLPRDLERMEAFIREKGVKLVVVDPLMAYLGSDVDSHKDQDVRRCLRPLSRLAGRLRIVVLLVRHLNKLAGGPALYRGSSSIAITGAGRASLIVGRDPMEDRFVLAMNKINVGPVPASLAYRVVGSGMGCKIEWDGECDLRKDQILGHGPPSALGGGPAKGRPATALEAAKHFLVMLLAGGAVETAEVMRRAEERKISRNTLDRARADLNVEPFRRDPDKVRMMRLPARGQAGTQTSGGVDESDLPFDLTDDGHDGSDKTPFE
jgi:archaellum biogenesis ATPase FlaH